MIVEPTTIHWPIPLDDLEEWEFQGMMPDSQPIDIKKGDDDG